SALISTGNTRVLCSVSLDRRTPPWMKDGDGGWVTAEYAMMPGSSNSRISRRLPNSRGTEIQRLIGRSLRSVVDLKALEGVTLTVDCDVIDADGGTRTASITGAWVALFSACQRLLADGTLAEDPIKGQVAAVSVGVVDDKVLLDLDYPEDSSAQVDFNVVGSGHGGLVEVQGTAGGVPFSRGQMDAMLDLSLAGISQLLEQQRAALGLSLTEPVGSL
ncbi:MAG: ribonuclease PH, partial [Myxococcales bacterium]|nr:ribonuclease PH [Myxococcales bacterium]